MHNKLYIKSSIILVIMMMFCSISVFAATEAPKITSTAAILMDKETGRILYQKNANEHLAMASTTKIMTAILLIENTLPDDIITVSKKAASIGGSSMKVRETEKARAEDMLYGLMLPSGNDAAIAIAEHIGGSVEGFAEMMNNKASELGCTNSHFVTPNGLDLEDDGHYSTARDLAEMTRYAMKYDLFNTVIATQFNTVQTDQRSINLKNTNPLLGGYNGADGVKTGFTNLAGRCIVASATRDNMRLIAVVLGSDSSQTRKEETAKILDYGFNNYKMTEISEYTDCSITTDIYKGKIKQYITENHDYLRLPITEEEKQTIKVEKYTVTNLEAPVKSGTNIGNVCVYVGNELVYKKDISIPIDIPKKSFLDYLGYLVYDISNIKFI